ncbi:MAG: YHS domain-containing protein [Candidatus Omnitrophota bacterium]
MGKCVKALRWTFVAAMVIAFCVPARVVSAKTIFIKDADNKYCPVTAVELSRKRFNTAYEGNRYWFSSYQAVQEFKKDPEKYVARLARQERR